MRSEAEALEDYETRDGETTKRDLISELVKEGEMDVEEARADYGDLKEEAESFVSLVRTQIAEVVRHIRRPDAYSEDAAVTAVAKIEAALDKLAILEA